MIKDILTLLRIVDTNIIKKFILLNLIFLFNSFIQLIYIYSIYPLVSSVTGYSNNFLLSLYDYKNKFYLSSLSDIEFSIIMFVFFSVLANLSIILTNYMNFNFTYATTTKVRSFFFHKISNNSYLKLISQDSSHYTTIIISQVERFCLNTLGSLSNVLNQVFLIILISAQLLISNFYISITLISFLIIIFAFLIFLIKKLFIKYGEEISINLENRNNLLLQLIRNFKEIKIFNVQKQYRKSFDFFEFKLNELYKLTSNISHSTKPLLEILLISILGFCSYFFLDFNNLSLEFLSKLSVILFSFYKLAPAFNSVYNAFNTISFDKDAVNKLILFSNKNQVTEKINPKIKNIDSVKLQQVNFGYSSKGPKVLSDVNLTLKKNNLYLLSGKSGSGKSTLLNMIMGLININNGNLLVNDQKIEIYENENWFKKVAYVSQNINLINDSILKNITIGNEKVDEKKVIKCLEDVGLLDDLRSRLKEKMYESSFNLSGGQLQRVGIARAIYRNCEIIILDEPTSNLDSISEKKIMKLISSLRRDKIIIVVSHKELTSIDFNKHFKIIDGKIIEE